MTQPVNPPEVGNDDAPVASVPVGPSEIVAYLTATAALLNGYLGQDYGLAKNSQAISILVGGLVVISSVIGRAIKHHGAMKANALTYATQASQLVTNLSQPLSLQGVSASVGTLATDLQADYEPKHAAAPTGVVGPKASEVRDPSG